MRDLTHLAGFPKGNKKPRLSEAELSMQVEERQREGAEKFRRLSLQQEAIRRKLEKSHVRNNPDKMGKMTYHLGVIERCMKKINV
jgi:hypothetical protein